MEIVIPLFLMEKERIIALEDKVIVEYANLGKEIRTEYKYSELQSRIVRGRVGDYAWTNIGNFLLTAAFVIAMGSIFLFFDFTGSRSYRLIVLGLASLALVAYCLRLVKYEKVWINEKNNDSSILFKMTNRNRGEAEQMISYIVEKINQAESKNLLKVE
jgi:hypothetical protein